MPCAAQLLSKCGRRVALLFRAAAAPSPLARLLIVVLLLAPHRFVPDVRHGSPKPASGCSRRLQGVGCRFGSRRCSAHIAGGGGACGCSGSLARSGNSSALPGLDVRSNRGRWGEAGRRHGPGRGAGGAQRAIEQFLSAPITSLQTTNGTGARLSVRRGWPSFAEVCRAGCCPLQNNASTMLHWRGRSAAGMRLAAALHLRTAQLSCLPQPPTIPLQPRNCGTW